MSDLRALEYATVRVPYETLNKRFRVAQKTIEREVCHTQQTLNAVEQLLTPSEVTADSLQQSVAALKQRLHTLAAKCTSAVKEEVDEALLVDERVTYLGQAMSSHNSSAVEWRQRRIDRLIMDYLLRAGYYDTCKELGNVKEMGRLSNLGVFEQAQAVVKSLEVRRMDVALHWCHENKSKLRRVHSQLEILLRRQDFVELVRDDKRMMAVHYAKKHFSNVDVAQWEANKLPHVLGLLAVHSIADCPPRYAPLLCESQWAVLVNVFWEEFYRIYQLPAQSSFSACLQSGLCALKTPHCQPVHGEGVDIAFEGSGKDCPLCTPEMYLLAAKLPYAHASQSKLVDAVTGVPLNEHNAPMALPNGMVYGTATLLQLANEHDGQITCPRTGQTFAADQAMRVYVM